MKEGYKDTPIGLIPEDWDVASLGEIGEFKNGINKSKEDFGQGSPFVNLMDVFGKSIVKPENLQLVNVSEKELSEFSLQKGDVLFVRSSVKPSGVGLTALVKEDIQYTVFSGFLIRFRDYKSMDTEFKRYCFYEYGFRKRLIEKSTVSANTNINQVALKSIRFILPSRSEQSKIASILSTVDDKIDAINERITQTLQLKKGLMHRLLHKGIGHTKFKDSPLGEIPESWEVGKIGSIAQTFAGGTPNRGTAEYYNGTIPWVKSGEVQNRNITKTEESITEKALKESSVKLIKPHSILVALYGATAGNVGILKINACSNQAVLAITSISDTTVNGYLYYILKQTAKKIISLTQGSGQPNLSKEIIDSLKIPLPPVKEQIEIAEILTNVDDKLDVLQVKKTEYEHLKKGLMQKLLTGRIRVKLN